MAIPRTYGGALGVASPAAMQADRNRDQFLRQYSQDVQAALRGPGGGAPGAAASDPIAEAQARIQQLTEGRAQEIQNDPYTTAALGYLRDVTGGAQTPFNDQVQNSILARQADGTAAAESARRQQMMDGFASSGMSASDPAAQAALRELSARRQQTNNANLGDLLSNANVQNFNARMAGANQLAAVRGAQNAQVNQMNLAGAGYRAQTFQDVPTGGSVGGSYTQTATRAPTNNGTAPAGATMQPRPQQASGWNPTPLAQRTDRSGWTPAQRAQYGGQPQAQAAPVRGPMNGPQQNTANPISLFGNRIGATPSPGTNTTNYGNRVMPNYVPGAVQRQRR